MENKDIIQNFLNKECIWVLNKASCTKKKVLTATTALSPMIKRHVRRSENHEWFLNVTVLILKPKDSLPCVTVFFNGEPVISTQSTVISMQPLLGSPTMFTIYFGTFTDEPHFPIPMDPSQIDNCPCTKKLVATDVIQTATLTILDDSKTYNLVAPTAWMEEHTLCEYMLCTDYQMMCPPLSVFPSLARIINLLTKCQNMQCEKCTGYHVHVNVYKGHTSSDEDGCNGYCPCTISCGLKNGQVPITGNQTLLPLLFDPIVAHTVKTLTISPKSVPSPINDIVCGLTGEGASVPVNAKAWSLVTLSDWHSHIYVISCKKLKKKCLHSY